MAAQLSERNGSISGAIFVARSGCLLSGLQKFATMRRLQSGGMAPESTFGHRASPSDLNGI
jgi:hypothetical protein